MKRSRITRWLLPAIAGVASVAFGLGLAELAAAIIAPTGSPLFVVGSLVIDLAPPWGKDLMVSLFGTGDKAALLTIMGIAIAIGSAGAGVLQYRRPPLGRVLIGLAAVVGVGAAITRSGSAPLDAVPTAVAAVAAVIALGQLLRRAPDPSAKTTADPSRRTFLLWAGGAVVAGGLTALVGQALQGGARAATAVRNAFKLPTPATTAAPVPAGAEFGIDGLAPVITPNKDFYRIDTALQIPRINPDDWSLKITGMVENEIELTWAELIALPLEESITTLTCVSNEVGGDLIGNALWLGYPIRNILARAKPKSNADMVLSRSQDGFTAGTPLSALQEEDRNAIFAVGMNGEALPEEHGFPVRMVVPGLYGYVSATKWVVELEVTRFDKATAYWTDRGWGVKGPIKLESRIDVFRKGSGADDGKVIVAGVAWQQHVGVSKVEVQVDDEPWAEAQLADAISADTWRQWRYVWPATKGDHRVRARATSSDGTVQTANVADVLPDGATGYHTVDVTI